MKYEAVMLDIETLGTRPGCVILSIGACEFNQDGIKNSYYDLICPESSVDWGLTIEPRTTLWWLEQNEEARKLLTQGKKTPLDIVLRDFIGAFKWKGKQVWCNGANFDFPILKAGLDAVGLREPWEYWSTMDYRTLKNLVPREVFDAMKVEATVKHDALADAISQAETAIKLLEWLDKEPVKKGVRRAA